MIPAAKWSGVCAAYYGGAIRTFAAPATPNIEIAETAPATRIVRSPAVVGTANGEMTMLAAAELAANNSPAIMLMASECSVEILSGQRMMMSYRKHENTPDVR